MKANGYISGICDNILLVGYGHQKQRAARADSIRVKM